MTVYASEHAPQENCDSRGDQGSPEIPTDQRLRAHCRRCGHERARSSLVARVGTARSRRPRRPNGGRSDHATAERRQRPSLRLAPQGGEPRLFAPGTASRSVVVLELLESCRSHEPAPALEVVEGAVPAAVPLLLALTARIRSEEDP